jgi:diguanylate cyclase (GGDEF)-like protein/PAS domain S-box-containing protein/hemerythrin-like metal-binding protein
MLASRSQRLFLAVLLLAGLPPAAQAIESVTLQLKWTHAFQFAGYYAASEKGFYRDAGLDVTLREAKPADEPVNIVVSGEAQYGVSNSSLLLARQAGQPVVALAAIFQHSPLVLITAQRGPEQAIHDLIGKRVMLEPQSDDLLAYFKREEIPVERITRLPHSFNPQDLIDGKVDAFSAYITSEPYYLDRAGFAYQTYSPRSAGIDFYGDLLFTTEQEISNHPARAEALRAASLRGWRYAMEHPEEIADLIMSKYSREHRREYFLFEAQQMAPLLRSELIEIGYMSPGRWRHIADTYADLGLLPRNFPLEGFLYDLNPAPDLTWLYLAVALLAVVSSIAIYVLRINRRLAMVLASSEQVQQALIFSEQRHRLLADNASDVIWTMDRYGRLNYVSPSVEKLLGHPVAEAMSQTLEGVLTPASAQIARAALERILKAIERNLPVSAFRGELEHSCKNGGTVWTEVSVSEIRNGAGEFIALLGVTRDISENKKMEARIRQLAFYDPLTNLPNRRLLKDRLNQAMAASKRRASHGALMFIDLDNFKPLNDSHGHDIGDFLLIEVAKRLNSCIREIDTAARFGGDEFVVILCDLDMDQEKSAVCAELIAEKIRIALGEPYCLSIRPDGGAETTIEHHCTASIGVTLFFAHDASADEIINRADSAMYRAKENGRNALRFAPERPWPISAVNCNAPQLIQLVWNSAFESGDALIDEQHRALFCAVNDLLNAILCSRPDAEVGALIDIVMQDVVEHSIDEEAIITRAGFPGAAEHAESHQQLFERAQVLIDRFRSDNLAIGELFQFLANDVIARHLLAEDREFFAHLDEQRQTAPPGMNIG